MEECAVRSLEGLFHKEITLYSDLRDLFRRERECLIHVDLDALWQISQEKEKVCAGISSVRGELFSAIATESDHVSLHPSSIMDLLPKESRGRCQILYMRIERLKGEIEELRKENKIIIDDSIRFLDEMISILTGDINSKIIYNGQCHLTSSEIPIMLRREV